MNFNMEGILTDKKYQITMEDGSVWEIPLILIAMNRANYYARVDEITFAESFHNDTVPLFETDGDEAEDWAKNNMDWDDVVSNAIMVQGPMEADYQEGWVNGEARVI